MNKIAAFILSFIILFQSLSFDLANFGKISILVNHISSHLNEGDNFMEFIEMHYGNKLENHIDKHDEHKKLPFKHQHLDAHFQLTYLVYFYQYPLKYTEDIFEKNKFNYTETTTTLVVHNFFQPPQEA